MASLPKSDEWSITYVLRRSVTGYHWFQNPGLDTWHLASNIVEGVQIGTEETLTGTRVAFDATRELRTLGVQLREIGNDGLYISSSDEKFRSMVRPLVNKYGNLFEVFDQGLEGREPFGDDAVAWLQVALDVADLWDLRRALVQGDFGHVAERFQVDDEGVTFKRSSGKTWVATSRKDSGRVWRRRQRWLGTPDRVTHSHVWAIFATAVNGYVESALSLALDPVSIGDPRIEVRGMAPVACTRLWLEVVHQREDELDRPQTCRECGNPIEGTRRKEFCSDRCRKAFSRKKVA